MVENWTVDHLERTAAHAIEFAVGQACPVMFVTEDTTRTDPDTVRRLYSTAIRSGATSIVLCDTVGHATPMGAYSLVQFVRKEVVEPIRRPRFASIGTVIATAAWRLPTPSPRFWPAPIKSTPPPIPSASASATRPWSCSWLICGSSA